ncbi:MAG: UbiA family prenyltransferase [Proteobacteria bacterium]|nr:UbiA family prenyltransferase [Pseudomonadota bacterium]
MGGREPQGAQSLPLVVDLDGTLVLSDMLHESVLALARRNPLGVPGIPFLLLRGRAGLKRALAKDFDPRPKLLPYNEPFLAWLREQRAAGRRLVLCTASDERLATAIASHLGLFNEVLASDGETNLGGAAKARDLCGRYGERGFDYAGNARADLPVWACARVAVVVNAPQSLAKATSGLCPVERHFPAQKPGLGVYLRMLRVYQWLKNLLLVVPLAAAHRLSQADSWPPLILGILSFCLCASAVYLANDLLDLESDRRHPRKRLRAITSGRVTILRAVGIAPVLLAGGVGLGLFVGPGFLLWLSCYFLLTCAYSLFLKRMVLVDCLTLALLYTLRIVAGGAATGVVLTFWLLAFSMFLFLSLAFVKRYAELDAQPPEADAAVHGRGYYKDDARLVQTLGIASGYASVLVLALYLNTAAVTRLYRTPEVVWAVVPVLLFWISWMWFKANRGEMHDDPLVFAVKDKPSLLAGLLFAAALAAGALVRL